MLYIKNEYIVKNCTVIVDCSCLICL